MAAMFWAPCSRLCHSEVLIFLKIVWYDPDTIPILISLLTALLLGDQLPLNETAYMQAENIHVACWTAYFHLVAKTFSISFEMKVKQVWNFTESHSKIALLCAAYLQLAKQIHHQDSLIIIT